MSSHAELFGRIIHHLTPSGQKPAKAQVYCPREELVDITETDPQKGSTHTVLWWNPEERPQEGSFVRVSGEWKSFRDDIELHVQETECTHHGIFEDVFAYSSQIQSIIKRKGVMIECGALCGFFAHPEPIVPLDIPDGFVVEPKESGLLDGQSFMDNQCSLCRYPSKKRGGGWRIRMAKCAFTKRGWFCSEFQKRRPSN